MGLMPNAGPSGPGREGAERKQGSLHSVNPLRLLLFGRPVATEGAEHTRLRKLVALPVFSSDAISSVAYATQQILLSLGAAGLWIAAERQRYFNYTMGITAAIVVLLVIVVMSYWQTIFAYPSGGGSYIVSKDNLGVLAGLVAGAALLIDYVLTVAVSVASGVQNLIATPIMQKHFGDHGLVPICLLFIGLITFMNLRGLKESGALFAVPTYGFVIMATILILTGVCGRLFGAPVLQLSEVNHTVPAGFGKAGTHLVGAAAVFLALRAFANGCSAMTGTEAVSNGIPAFREPRSRNAALTLVAMAVILGGLLGGISWLAASFHMVYWEHGRDTAAPVIDQLARAIFGHGTPLRETLYYGMQFSTLAILVVAANTSYADFPRLAAILSRDRFLPRQLSNQGDKLVFSNGILLLGLFSAILIVAFHGSVDRLIPLYAVGVFTAFTLSQSGMVIHWLRTGGPGWQIKAIINGFGAVCTFVVLVNIIVEKALEGAWMVIVVAAILIVIFWGIAKHYEYVRRNLSIINFTPDATPFTNTVLLLMPSLHRGIFPALEYARSLSSDCRAIHIEIDPNDTPRLAREWEQFVGEDIPLVVLPSPYRSLIGPLLAYLDHVQAERPNHMVTVVLPEFVPGKWWHRLLHNSSAPLVKYYLGQRPGVVLSNVRYFLSGKFMGPEQDGTTPAAQAPDTMQDAVQVETAATIDAVPMREPESQATRE